MKSGKFDITNLKSGKTRNAKESQRYLSIPILNSNMNTNESERNSLNHKFSTSTLKTDYKLSPYFMRNAMKQLSSNSHAQIPTHQSIQNSLNSKYQYYSTISQKHHILDTKGVSARDVSLTNQLKGSSERLGSLENSKVTNKSIDLVDGFLPKVIRDKLDYSYYYNKKKKCRKFKDHRLSVIESGQKSLSVFQHHQNSCTKIPNIKRSIEDGGVVLEPSNIHRIESKPPTRSNYDENISEQKENTESTSIIFPTQNHIIETEKDVQEPPYIIFGGEKSKSRNLLKIAKSVKNSQKSGDDIS